MPRFPLLVTGLLALILIVAFANVRQAKAQFSETWEFLKAVEEDNRSEILDRHRNGANINATNGDGLPAIIIAADQGNVSLMRFILDLGVNINGREESRRETALMRRAELGDFESAHFLVENGADVNLKDKGGETALMKAARARKSMIVRLLLDAGADVNDADYTGRTALDYAQAARARGIVRLLRAAGSSD